MRNYMSHGICLIFQSHPWITYSEVTIFLAESSGILNFIFSHKKYSFDL